MIRYKQEDSPIIIDLDGPEGNAWAMLGLASSLGKKLGLSEEERDKIRDDMTSGDYENLIKVFDDHFGAYVILERTSHD